MPQPCLEPPSNRKEMLLMILIFLPVKNFYLCKSLKVRSNIFHAPWTLLLRAKKERKKEKERKNKWIFSSFFWSNIAFGGENFSFFFCFQIPFFLGYKTTKVLYYYYYFRPHLFLSEWSPLAVIELHNSNNFFFILIFLPRRKLNLEGKDGPFFLGLKCHEFFYAISAVELMRKIAFSLISWGNSFALEWDAWDKSGGPFGPKARLNQHQREQEALQL